MSKVKGYFLVTTPYIKTNSDILNDSSIQKVLILFDGYSIKWHTCDTIEGSFCLNQEWVEMQTIVDLNVEYNKVTIEGWHQEDIEIFNDLAFTGKIIVRVVWVVDGKYIPNH